MTLQLRWRNPRIREAPEQLFATCEIFPPTSSLEVFMARWNVTIPNKHRDKWRTLYPNVGELDGFPHFGNVYIMATDGILAYYHVDFSGSLFLGHLKAFNGPIAKDYVYEDDWDYVNKKRKVNIFKLKDGTIVVVPKDTFWDNYRKHHDLGQGEVSEKQQRKAKYQAVLDSI